MDRRCVDCSHYDLQASPEGLARHGFGYCPLRSMHKGHTFSAVRPHQCEKFQAAPAPVAAKRMTWLQKKGAV